MRLKNQMYKLVFLVIYFWLICYKDAFAYLDPGTGSMIFQAVIAVFLTVIVAGKIWWSKVKLFIQKLFLKKNENA